MVTFHHQAQEQLILIQPNRSSSWAINRRILLAVALLHAVIATGFASIGAWMILPFAGLEVAALLAALYWVNWKLTYRHVLHFRGDSLCIEKGFYHPKQTWRWPKADASLLVNQPRRRDEPLSISVCHGNDTVMVGDFLSLEDSQQLLRQLRALGLPVKTHSSSSQLPA